MRKKNRDGFTFIELLLALTLFALIAAGVYQTFYMGTKVWAKGNGMMKENHRLRVLFNTLSQDAVNATVFDGEDPKETVWEKRRARFATLANSYRDGKPGVELARVEYRFDRRKGVLSRKYVPVAGRSGKKASRETVFFEGLEDAAFGYFSAGSEPEGGMEWNEKWTRKAKEDLPRGIKIRLRFKATKDMTDKQFEKVIMMPPVRFEGKV